MPKCYFHDPEVAAKVQAQQRGEWCSDNGMAVSEHKLTGGTDRENRSYYFCKKHAAQNAELKHATLKLEVKPI